MITPVQLVKSARATVKECDNKQLCQAIDNKHLVIDVREPDEYAQGYIAHAVNVPRGLIEFAIFDHPLIKPELDQADPANTKIFIYCKSGGRSALAAQSLQSMGFKDVYSLQGGIMGWEAEQLKISSEKAYHY